MKITGADLHRSLYFFSDRGNYVLMCRFGCNAPGFRAFTVNSRDEDEVAGVQYMNIPSEEPRGTAEVILLALIVCYV